jgi:hypothetical protein
MKVGKSITERCIRRDLRERLKWIESQPNWQQGDRFSAAHWAYVEARKIVRRHFKAAP